MKKFMSILFVALAVLSGSAVQAEEIQVKGENLPCDKQFFQYLCNPKLKIVEKCYDCHRLDNGKSKCFPAFSKFDITDFLSTKKWDCNEHEWHNPFSDEEFFFDKE